MNIKSILTSVILALPVFADFFSPVLHEKFDPPLRLDDSAKRFETLSDVTGWFTVSLWVKPIAFGEKALSREWVNGMLCNSGTGYYDGWRLTVQEPGRFRPVFEIGRAEGSIAVTAEFGLTTNVWNHVAATWTPSDAESKTGTMRLYVNGRLAGERENAPAPLAPNAPFSIGYSDFGVGALIADFGEVKVEPLGVVEISVSDRFLYDGYDPLPTFDHAEAQGVAALKLKSTAVWWHIAMNETFDPWQRVFAAKKSAGYEPEFPDANRPSNFKGVEPIETRDASFEIPWGDFTREADGVWSVRAASELFALTPFGTGVNERNALMIFTDDGRLLKPARWPNDGFITCTNVLDQANSIVALDFERAKKWVGEKPRKIFAHGYWKYSWADAGLPAEIFMTNSVPALRLTQAHNYGFGDAPKFQLWNLREELDAPGEYFYDEAAGKLFLIPPEGGAPKAIKITQGTEPFLLVENQEGVEFIGITFTGTRGDAVVVRNAKRAFFKDCIFKGIGGAAIAAENVSDIFVNNCEFDNTGHHAIIVNVGDRRKLREGLNHLNLIEGNKFSRTGQMQRTYTPGVLVDGVGARIFENDFFDMPSSALRIEGNDHWVNDNRFWNVVLESDDQGAIDLWGNPSYRGNKFFRNIFRDIGGANNFECGAAAIRLDDAICGAWIYENLFINASKGNFGAVQIHGGKDNIVYENKFVDCAIGVSFSPWGAERWRKTLTENEEILDKIYKQVDITKPPYTTRYPELKTLLDNADANNIFMNRFENCGKRFFNAPPNTKFIWNE